MTDFSELMKILSTHAQTGVWRWSAHGRHCKPGWSSVAFLYSYTHFAFYPYWGIAIGVWLILSRSFGPCYPITLGWPSLAIALLGLLGGLVDTVTAFHGELDGRANRYNLLASFGLSKRAGDLLSALR